MKETLSIGEFASMFGLNVQTLHYYDSIGLFKPRQKDEQTGRRKYTFDQVYKLASIRYMRRLGYSLEDIRSYMDCLDVDFALTHLKARSIELRRQWEELFAIDRAIQRKIRFVERSLQEEIDLDAVTIRTYGERRYLPIGEEDKLYYADAFYFYPTLAFYEGNAKSFGAYLYEDGESDDALPMENIDQKDVKVLPAGQYLCTYHKGPYEHIEQSEKRLRAAHPDLRLSDQLVNFNIVDQFVERNSEKYITHMQVRILP